MAEPIDNRVSLACLKPANQDFRLNVASFKTPLEFLGGVLSVDEDHCHGAFKPRVQTHHEVNLLSFCRHLHFQVLHTLQLLGLFLNWEVLEVADNTTGELDDLVRVGGRVEAVLWRHIQLCQMLLEHEEALVVRLLDKELVSFIVDDQLQLAEVKVARSGSKAVLEVARDCDEYVTQVCEAFLSKDDFDLGLAG